MECVCISIEHDEISRLLADRWRNAKKPHRGGECHREIHSGERYRIETIVYSGRISAHKTCNDCESLKDVFFCNGYVFGDVWADFQEGFDYCFDEMPWSKLPGLTDAARNRVFQLVEDCWEENGDDDE